MDTGNILDRMVNDLDARYIQVVVLKEYPPKQPIEPVLAWLCRRVHLRDYVGGKKLGALSPLQ